jgi:hypothetical protein
LFKNVDIYINYMYNKDKLKIKAKEGR